MTNLRFLPSLTTTIRLPSGTISTPSLNHLTSASSSSTSILNSTLSSSTQSFPWSWEVNLWGNSPTVRSQVQVSSPSLPNGSILQVYLPASSSSHSLMVRPQSPPLFSIRNLGSEGLISTPSLNHLTWALGSSILHRILTFFLVWPCFLSSIFFSKPYSGSGGSTSNWTLQVRSLHSRMTQVYLPLSAVSGFLMIRVNRSSSCVMVYFFAFVAFLVAEVPFGFFTLVRQFTGESNLIQ